MSKVRVFLIFFNEQGRFKNPGGDPRKSLK